ncbi:hypothetical protein TRFO_09626 [Tritrichomonas foetus]|uniref:Golgin-84 n=1 Tax=Tritrichomonas foetus TaxID=1144522 RepID=A0A1J4JD12_9EUKA|nr:hypothetical protein TRFO_09626 [Tritrichomonas foetus]|eukprot:OHS97078.1 hypothetical protein TRFO_09626 [Tritrichomonas foetus]
MTSKMDKVFDWLTNKIEDFDNQAAGIENNRDYSYDSNTFEHNFTNDLNSLRAKSQRDQTRIASLEDQLSRLEKSNAHFENEMASIEQKNIHINEENQHLRAEVERLKSTVKSLERKQGQDLENYEKARTNFDEMKNKLEKEVAALSSQLSASQHELSIKTNDLTRLGADLLSKQAEVTSLESEISKYRENAVQSLTSGSQDNSMSAGQLELLENERNRIKDRYNKSEQRIAQLEAASREIEVQMQNELGDAKQQQTLLETELFKSKTQIEALTHEVSLLRAQLISVHEASEAKFKAQIEAERMEHRSEISRLKENFANSSKSSNQQERILHYKATIESLKSEKAALLLMLESGRQNPNNDIAVDVVQRRQRVIPFVALLPPRVPPFIYDLITKADVQWTKFSNFFSQRPLFRLLAIFWVILVHILLIL